MQSFDKAFENYFDSYKNELDYNNSNLNKSTNKNPNLNEEQKIIVEKFNIYPGVSIDKKFCKNNKQSTIKKLDINEGFEVDKDIFF